MSRLSTMKEKKARIPLADRDSFDEMLNASSSKRATASQPMSDIVEQRWYNPSWDNPTGWENPAKISAVVGPLFTSELVG